MSTIAVALRAGRSRGLIELRQSVTNTGDLLNHLLWPALMLAALYFLRDRTFPGGALPLGALVLPSILGMNAAMAMVSMSQQLTADREDGTLLRARATPYGIIGYLTGKLISVSGGLLLDLAIFAVPAMFLVDGLALARPATWWMLAGVLLLGLVATLPAGAVLGSVFTSARSQGLLTLPVLAVIGISGIFYPITVLPGWLQGVAQAFPVYWMGLGMRSALLPPEAVAVEIADSWRHLETAGVLGAWAVVGLVATLPAGAVLGSVFTSARSQGLLTLPVLAVIGISGIFYPITVLPGWLQGVAQAFPVYWMGLGMRSALLPPEAVAVEIADSWRHLETAGVLGAWAVVGLVAAPLVLRRMARRESGSTVAERRDRAMQRIG